MIKLKKTISQIDTVLYEKIESSFQKNRAENFLFLFRAYRANKLTDTSIAQALQLTSNSFYVLKSRLYDKVQEFLSGDLHVNKEDVIRLLHRIPEMLFSAPSEVSTAFLLKLEKELTHFDMHNELLTVYSALKKLNLNSDKYFQYSQAYNKHLAFTMSLEKSEELLGNFMRSLGQYQLSRSSSELETLRFLQTSVRDHLALNQSRQIEIILHLIEIHLDLFCDISPNQLSTEECLKNTETLLSELPESSAYKSWKPALDYLFFEYFRKIGDLKMAQQYFLKIEPLRKHLLLFSSVSLTAHYLISRTMYLQQIDQVALLADEDDSAILHDENDLHSEIILGIYKSMVRFYRQQYKEAAAILNNLLNLHSFKDYFHANSEIRMTLAYFYLTQREYDLADNLIKNIQRKIKSEKIDRYANLLDLIKVFAHEIKHGNCKADPKQVDNFLLFTGRNKGEQNILKHLLIELQNKYH